MEIIKIPFEKIPQFSKKDIAYYNEDPALKPFFKYPANIQSFQDVINDKKQDNSPRKLLVEVLKEQYISINISKKVQDNIDLLSETNTFTLITAHQPSLFTGPLYYIFKIISTINLAKTLSESYPSYQFVPVFITGGEDHDFEEVNHFQIFNKTLTWESDEKGAVGMMKTHTIQPVLDNLREIIGTSENAKNILSIIEQTHTKHDIYSNSIIELTQELFKDEGLVILNMNHPRLKKHFIPYIKTEIIYQSSFPVVNQTISELEQVGISAQAAPREINFFYLRDQLRERIIFEDEVFKVLNSDFTFSKAEMENEIENHPERFSPNVIMRPIYQESILPNLAYIGGGGEIAYWLERKAQFEHFGINFPMLIRRNSAMWIDKGALKKLNKFKISLPELAGDIESLIKDYVKVNSEGELSLSVEKENLKLLFEGIAEKTKKIDATLVKTVLAEHAKQNKSLEQLERRLMKVEKQRFDVSINQIRNLKEKLFPKNGLTERKENFIQYYIKYGDTFFEVLKSNLHPLEKGFVVILDND